MAGPDRDLLAASAAVVAAFEWEKVDPPGPVGRAARAVLRAVSAGSMIATGYELAGQVIQFAWLQLDPSYRPALDATDEFLLQMRFELDVTLWSGFDHDATDPTLRLAALSSEE